MWTWAFLIDLHLTPIVITASYKDVREKAKEQAKFGVMVLPYPPSVGTYRPARAQLMCLSGKYGHTK